MADYGKVKSGERVRRTVVVDVADAKALKELLKEQDISFSFWVRGAMATQLRAEEDFCSTDNNNTVIRLRSVE